MAVGKRVLRGKPDLASYDAIVVSSSAGKDSQTALEHVVLEARRRKVDNRVLVSHCDLGRIEWPGSPELAQLQAAYWGVPAIVIRRTAKPTDLLDLMLRRGQWPGFGTRYCTAAMKRGPGDVLFTGLGRDYREQGNRPPIRILHCMGIRADESAERGAMPPYYHDLRASTSNKHVDVWLPVHAWKAGTSPAGVPDNKPGPGPQVWRAIEASGAPFHPAYETGMARLSCIFCPLADWDSLVIAGRYNPELLDAFIAAERKVGPFKGNRSLRQAKTQIETGDVPRTGGHWADECSVCWEPGDLDLDLEELEP